mmetsp:Transcript_21197/g.29617  ORF Transcript_21197/g.29617 Transcript_21197/m.29617 type:complete len:82 (-) Transcript_21197:391-636(-)
MLLLSLLLVVVVVVVVEQREMSRSIRTSSQYDDEDDDDGKNQVATSSKVEVDRFKEEPIGRYVMPSDLYPIKANKREGRKK